jgi:hypothetical protein
MRKSLPSADVPSELQMMVVQHTIRLSLLQHVFAELRHQAIRRFHGLPSGVVRILHVSDELLFIDVSVEVT